MFRLEGTAKGLNGVWRSNKPAVAAAAEPTPTCADTPTAVKTLQFPPRGDTEDPDEGSTWSVSTIFRSRNVVWLDEDRNFKAWKRSFDCSHRLWRRSIVFSYLPSIDNTSIPCRQVVPKGTLFFFSLSNLFREKWDSYSMVKIDPLCPSRMGNSINLINLKDCLLITGNMLRQDWVEEKVLGII